MRRSSLTLTALSIVLLVAGAGLAQGIGGSAHDFSGSGWNTSGEICITCHTPHNAIANPDGPLWNHEVTAATFTPYTSTTLDATVGQPNGVSKLCLSCHDGTVALDNFGGTTNGTNIISGGAALGSDMTNDHPVSFAYDATLAGTDTGLNDPTTTASGLGGTITATMLSSGQMQCSSCHDPHDSAGISNLLVKSNGGSALCLTCHNK